MLNNNFQLLTQLPEIIKDSGDIGTFELDIFKIDIKRERQKMVQKWGKHIPSLLQEDRNSKIEKIYENIRN